MVSGYGNLFRSKNVVANVDAKKNVVVKASEELLETVIENLIENALTFSPAGGAIMVGLRKQAGFVQLAVEDQGPGVPEEDLGRIFERYYSRHLHAKTETSANDETSHHFGIGLWVVRRNMEAVSGTVAATKRN